MRSGDLNKRVSIEHFTTTTDSWGQPTEEWVKLVDVWADVRFQSGKEFISADRMTAQTQASIRIRKRAVDTKMRVVFDGRVYEITAVLPDRRRVYIDLAVKEIV